MTTRVLVLGGARSGKSRFAESLLEHQPEVEYVATAFERPDDGEWTARIAAHRAQRPGGWTTTETGDVAAVLRSAGRPALVDSMTTWLAALIDAPELERAVDELVRAWVTSPRQVVAVSDEVGFGVVPETPLGRRFRDALGLLNQRLATDADEVHLVVAGVPLRLK